MKKISIKKIIYPLLVSVLVTGCGLESELYSDIDTSIFPKNDKDAQTLVTSCYDIFSSTGYADKLYSSGGGMWVLNTVISDYGFVDRDDEKWLCMMYPRWTPDTANKGDVNSAWGFMNQLTRMEMTVNTLNGMTTINEDMKNRYIAEVQCAQALLAFTLYDLYGPLIIAGPDELADPEKKVVLPRKTEAEMEEYITGRLNAAATTLEAWEAKNGAMEFGRFNSGLCHMVLMKYYMQTRQWAKAVTEGRAIQNNKTYNYELNQKSVAGASKYHSIFYRENEQNNEIIYAVPNVTGLKEMKWPAYVRPSDDKNIGGCWRMWTVPWTFYDEFDDADERKATMQDSYTTSDGTVRDRENPGVGGNQWNSMRSGVIIDKYPMEQASYAEKCDIDYIVYRYADAVTLLAEALVKTGTDYTGEPLQILNAVRTRAGLPAYTLAEITSKAKFLEALLDERAKELYWEGCRRQDLIRNDIFNSMVYAKCIAANQRTTMEGIDPSTPEAASTVYYDKNDKKYWYYRIPLPESVIAEGKGLVEQNPY